MARKSRVKKTKFIIKGGRVRCRKHPTYVPRKKKPATKCVDCLHLWKNEFGYSLEWL